MSAGVHCKEGLDVNTHVGSFHGKLRGELSQSNNGYNSSSESQKPRVSIPWLEADPSNNGSTQVHNVRISAICMQVSLCGRMGIVWIHPQGSIGSEQELSGR